LYIDNSKTGGATLCAVAWEATDRTPCVTVQLDTHFLALVRPGVLIETRGPLDFSAFCALPLIVLIQ
jgi:hypothetical protein